MIYVYMCKKVIIKMRFSTCYMFGARVYPAAPGITWGPRENSGTPDEPSLRRMPWDRSGGNRGLIGA